MKGDVVETELLSLEEKQAIDEWSKKYPADKKRAAVMRALMIVQENNGGYLTTPLMNAVAAHLEMPQIAVYEVATFYSMYDLKKVGKHKICVCTNISCMLRGSAEVVSHLESRLGVKVGNTTADGRYTLKEVECLAACGGAPMMQIDKTYYENLTPEKIDAILSELEAN
jgi:NADH-quinone oxidoreductase subunit E